MLQRCLVGWVALVLASASASLVFAQDEEERAGGARGEYAWGSNRAEPDDPLRIQAYAGAGFGVRLLANLDPPFNQKSFLTPAYLEVGGAVFFPGSELRHGVGLNVATNLTQDVDSAGIQPFAQWALTPSYHLLIPLRRLVPDLQHDWLQIQGRLGIPIVLGSALSGDGVDISVGGELAAAVHFKFLAGFGAYLEAQVAIYGGSLNTVHPILAFDAGLLFDYEVLP